VSDTMDSSSALDNSAVAHLIRAVVSRFQKAGPVVNPSSRLERYASLFDTDTPTDDASCRAPGDASICRGFGRDDNED